MKTSEHPAPKPTRRKTSDFRNPTSDFAMPLKTPLASLQREVARIIMSPLTKADRMRTRQPGGANTAALVEDFIKPNDRLTSFERLEIYNRQYWFRLLDCLYEDYPGLCALLGQPRFHRLLIAYLTRYPSASPDLRHLGQRLPAFIAESPAHTAPYQAVALDMARLEHAQSHAFDAAERRPITTRQLAAATPETLRLDLQPHATLLALRYPVDEIVIRLMRDHLRADTSAAQADHSEQPPRKYHPAMAHRVRPESVHLLVYRADHSVYFKRLSASQYTIVSALAAGRTLAESVAPPYKRTDESSTTDSTEDLRSLFSLCAALRLLCPSRSPSR
ncbi:putative DNA-binding domain-containing protein [Terrimicrobium sacchariphilum]|uniref:Putative DNA-binding domain-containing protein n=1 Tax=Terrimicrobium sacchariphilum TaxID=690879 RepID=A0A146GAY9_TERSA|nr:DNA-binding domain-containing protein [Terrimicrobium sacchariphilum]GAT34571.1 putative DNA-binding domain-containing protein [Terrimicrobium sacchariphilum]